MQFCPVCDSMLYVRTSPEGHLLHHCRQCGHEEVRAMNVPGAQAVAISTTEFRDPGLVYATLVRNPHLGSDPTLPRLHGAQCPNAGCPSRASRGAKAPEIIYVRYDHTALKFLYLCTTCQHFWRTDGGTEGAAPA
jgi:hypothetical protein